MAGKNQVTLTFAGDHDQLEKAMASVGQSADKMASNVGSASKRMGDDVRSSADSFDRAGQAADDVDTKAMGFRDTMTGVQDSMLGVSRVAKGDLFEGFLLLGMGAGDLGSGLYNTVIPAFKSLRTGMKNVTSFITGPWGAAIGAAAIAGLAVFKAVQAWNAESERAKQRQEELAQIANEVATTLDKETGSLTTNTREWAFRRLEQMHAIDAAKRLDLELDLVVDAALGEKDALALVNTVLDENTEKSMEAGKVDRFLRDQVTILGTALGLTNEEMDAAITRFENQAEAVEGTTGAVQGQINSLKELGDVLKAQTDPVFAFVAAQEAVKKAQDEVTEAEREFGRESPQWESAVLDLAKAQLDFVSAAGEAEGAVDDDLIPALEQMRQDGLLSEDAFNELVDAMKDTKREADRLDGTRSRITVETVLHTIHETTIIGGKSQYGQHGGLFSGWTMVGEAGPELVKLPVTSQVFSHENSRSMLSSLDHDERQPARYGQSQEFIIRSSGSEVDDLLVKILSRAIGDRGGSVQGVLGSGRLG